MNHMAEIAKMLGVELGEEFEIEFPDPSTMSTTAVFNENEFRIVKTDAYIVTPYWKYSVLHSLLVGSLTIKRKPWKPKEDEYYWSVNPDGTYSKRPWFNVSGDISNYKLGNCYRTYEEAKANRDKWIKFYVSDGVLEV